MPRAELFFLLDELHLGDGGSYGICRMADDDRNVCGGASSGTNDMFDKRSTAHAMEHLRVFGFHAGALACRKNQYLQFVHFRPSLEWISTGLKKFCHFQYRARELVG